MKMFLHILTLLLSFSAPSFAALPLLWQNVAELKSILNDQQLADRLQSGEVLLEIKKREGGWTIETNHHTLNIDVVYQRSKMPEPQHFTLKFGQPIESLSR